MHRYRNTFARHKIVLLLPIVIAVVASVWYARSVPKTYQTTMNLWFDTAAPNPSSLQQLPQGQTPAQGGQAELQEFIGTEQFLVNVGRRGPLAADLEKSGITGKAEVNAEITSDLEKAFTVTATGPQVVQVEMTSHDPSYMVGTLNALATEYVDEVTGTLRTRDQASVSYYDAEVRQATTALGQANSALQAYERAHPNATTLTDVNLSQLSQTASQDQTNLTTLQGQLQSTQIALQNANSWASFRVVDPPLKPYAKSLKKHDILIGLAGLLSGVVISSMLLSALTSLDRTARSQEDIVEVMGIDVIASISNLRRRPEIGIGRAKTS